MKSSKWILVPLLLLLFAIPVVGQSGSLPAYVMRIFPRDNVWTGTNTFHDVVITGSCSGPGCAVGGGGSGAAEDLTGTTIAANVINSSLRSVGTLTNLTVTNPIVGSITGASGSTTGNAATATSLAVPSQTAYDLFYALSANQTGRVANGTTGQLLTATSGAAPSWTTPSYLSATSIDTSAELRTILTDETGTGVAVFATSPSLAGATLTGHLLFTDATYDIGASGATRPRNLYLSGNAVIGGTLNVTGTITGAATALAVTSQAAYDLFYATGANTISRIPNGTTGQILVATTGGAPTWTTAGAGLAATDIDTSAELAGILTDETGTGSFVLANYPTFNGLEIANGFAIRTDTVVGHTFVIQGRNTSTPAYESLLTVTNVAGTPTIAIPTLTGTLKIAGQYYSPMVAHGAAGATETLDWNNGNEHRVVLDENVTLTLSNPVDGGRYVVIFVQDGTGTNTVTWPASVIWSEADAPIITPDANAVSLCTLIYDSTLSKYLGACNLDMR